MFLRNKHRQFPKGAVAGLPQFLGVRYPFLGLSTSKTVDRLSGGSLAWASPHCERAFLMMANNEVIVVPHAAPSYGGASPRLHRSIGGIDLLNSGGLVHVNLQDIQR